jgi:Asp-tRNA(Asn)/Glu-tRNA(Gln) amidotransferase A subunit family amidase
VADATRTPPGHPEEARVGSGTVPTSVEGELPDGLLEAFDAYERALAAVDQAALAAAFEPTATVMRADAGGLLVGHDAITAFRARRGSGPVRRVVECHVRVVTADVAIVVSVNAPAAGGRGVVTQLWRRDPDAGPGGARSWRIASAQVQASPPAIDRRVWRVVGEPLVSGSRGDDPTGTAPPALSGETVAVKDLFAVAGHAIGAGVPARLAGAAPESRHAAAVQHLLDAGADLRGIAQTDEFAYSIAGRNSAYGTPPNPAVPGAIPGGSTSGPAAAVALGQVSIALGTDTGGSLRVPASYQGLWGIRTTHGAVDRAGLLPLAPSFDTVGWLTREVDTLRRAARASVSLADQVSVEPSYVVDPRVLASVEPGVRAGFVRALDEATAAGRVERPEEVVLGDVAHLFELFRVLQAFEAWQSDGDWITEHPGELAADVSARFAFGATVSPGQAEEARVALGHERRRLEALLDGRVLLLPSASSAAPALGATAAEVDAVRSATLGLTCIAGVLGAPAVSAPVLEVPLASGRRAPVGLCLVGPRGADLSLLDLAATWAT